MRIQLTPAPEYSCLTVHRLKPGSGHILCADCGAPLAIIQPGDMLPLNWLAHYEDVPLDEYIEETVCCEHQGLGERRGRELCRVLKAHVCDEQVSRELGQ